MTSIPALRPATADDFDLLLEIRREVAADLQQRGIPASPNGLTRNHLEEWTAAKVLWVGDLQGTVIGSIAVWFHDPTDHWPRSDRAAYVRDLMVSPRHRNEGIGAVMLSWAERFSAGVGRRRVRLDCDSSNARLLRYYSEAGYGRVGIDDEGFALFEKELV